MSQSSYTDFARVYDTFMDNVPYEMWGNEVLAILKEGDITEGLIADLGCGTGTFCEWFAKAGFDMIGIDNSPEMLEIAQEKKASSGADILYLLQDMREFELYGTVRAVLSICDSVNYILEPEELTEVFCLVNNYLDPKGLFVFDFNTVHKYRDVLGDSTIAEEREECSFIWDNYYYEEEQMNEYDLTLFLQESKEEKNLFRKFKETHIQRGYTLEEMKKIIADSGLEFVSAVDVDTTGATDKNSERIRICARERGK